MPASDAKYETHEHDVLVIGAGGAGLRAAIEASAEGLSVGLVCKSLLGKAHTVMAEGGVAAALGNVEPKDNWKVHFRDTMKGGRYLNQWRMAQLHAMEAPDRVNELEEWGALFDRTRRRANPPAQLRRPQVPAPRARRRPHRPRDDPHAPAARHPLRDAACTWSARSRGSSCDGDRVRGAFGYWRESGRFVVFQREGGRARDGRHRARVPDQLELVGVHGRRAGARVPRRRGAHGHGVHAVSPDRDGVAAQRPRHAHHRGRSRRRRNAPQQRRQAHHVRLHPRALRQRDGERPRTRPTSGSARARRASRRRRAARRISCRATSSPAPFTPR